MIRYSALRNYRPLRGDNVRVAENFLLFPEDPMGQLVDGKWTDEDLPRNEGGKFVRKESPFRKFITADGSSGFKAEPDRYHIYVSHN